MATDKLAVTAGLRYTQEEKNGLFSHRRCRAAPCDHGFGCSPSAKLSDPAAESYYPAKVFDEPVGPASALPTAGTDGIMSYATFAHSEKSGGITWSGLPLDATTSRRSGPPC